MTAPDRTQPTPSIARAAAWMGGWLTLLLVISISGREAMREVSVFQLMEVRAVLGLLLLAPLVRASGGLRAIQTERLGHHVARNAMHYSGQLAWFVALAMIPLAQVVAIEFTMPIWTVLLAAAFLGERIHTGKVLAVVLGVIGVAMIVRPGGSDHATGQLIALASAVGFAVAMTMTKSLTRTENVVGIIFWMLLIQGLIGLVPAILSWQWPPASTWGWMAVVAFCGTFSHYCIANAMRHADATVVVPMDFLRVPLSALLGWLIYSEQLDLMTGLGAALILAGNLANIWRSRRQ